MPEAVCEASEAPEIIFTITYAFKKFFFLIVKHDSFIMCLSEATKDTTYDLHSNDVETFCRHQKPTADNLLQT